MNENRNPDEALDVLLRQWSVAEHLPPRFQEKVWRRIAQAEEHTQPTTVSRLLRLLEVVLPRPKVALVYMALFLALGVATGTLTAEAKSNRVESELGLRYVQSIDPYRAEDLSR